MGSFPAYFCHKILAPFPIYKLQKCPPVRSQRLHDEGKSANNVVDANMNILRRRIEQERMKERQNIWCRSRENGWNYDPGYDNKFKKRALFEESFGLAALVGSTIGLVFLAGSIFVFLYSLLMHIHIYS